MSTDRKQQDDMTSTTEENDWPDYPFHRGQNMDLHLNSITEERHGSTSASEAGPAPAAEDEIEIDACTDYVLRAQNGKYCGCVWKKASTDPRFSDLKSQCQDTNLLHFCCDLT